MSLTDEQEEKFLFWIDEIKNNLSRLNDWERGFIKDQLERYEKYKSGISMSPKQWAVMEKMYTKVTDPA